jgi:hypothetical protein
VVVASLLLVVVAVALLVTGLEQQSNMYLIGSVSASMIAAVLLIVGGRQATGPAADTQEETTAEPAGPQAPHAFVVTPRPVAADTREVGEPGRPGQPDEAAAAAVPDGTAAAAATAGSVGAVAPDGTAADPVQVVRSAGQVDTLDEADQDRDRDRDGDEYEDDDDDETEEPPDEPPPQPVSAADAARIAGMTDEVLVVDGRPRYHRAGCLHLMDRRGEPLPVAQAVHLGFTPCSRCEPNSALLGWARRG